MKREEDNPMDTARLTIRRFHADDWEDLHEYLSQPEVVKFEPYEVFSREESRREAVRRAADPAFWAVCLKDAGKLIGNIYLSRQDCDTWELGYVFNTAYQGQGYATEAARAVLDWAFREQAAHRVTAMCNPINAPSWRLMERLGLRREGHLLQNISFKKDSQGQPIWCDTYIYGILASAWMGE